ncbi:ATP adenylyltransferase-domain-containing protein [Lactarius deliciosus]|nr:ATP adenylyltransferase-domain-containing protein [Lactarius deliciosus]
MAATSPPAIVSAIRPAFEKGKASGDLLFFPSEVHTHKDLGIDFEIRLCPALLQKPPLPAPHFELKDEEEGTEYVVLLNNHFLLVTKGDLVQAYLLLRAAHKAGNHLFAFYNCGEQSGASQPHKHLQFLPTADEDGPPIERLARAARIDQAGRSHTPCATSKLIPTKQTNRSRCPPSPLPTTVRRLALPTTRSELEPALAQAFVELLDLCISTVRHAADYTTGGLSYNVVLTLGHLYVFPRRRESHRLALSGEELSVNALGFAGFLLVKSDAELRAVTAEGPTNVLKAVACASVHDLQVGGGPEFDGIAS